MGILARGKFSFWRIIVEYTLYDVTRFLDNKMLISLLVMIVCLQICLGSSKYMTNSDPGPVTYSHFPPKLKEVKFYQIYQVYTCVARKIGIAFNLENHFKISEISLEVVPSSL